MKTETQRNRINRVINHLSDAGEYVEIATDYAEPGYYLSDENGLVVFGNWNPSRFPRDGEPALTKAEARMARAGALLEKLGCGCEWSDEWTTCGDCGKAVRTQPDCYEWQPSYVIYNDCEPVCEDCVAENPDEYFEDMEGSADKSHHISTVDPADHGYVASDEWFENGSHPGQNDDPKKIAGILERHGIERFFFETKSSQFYISFRVWIHESENGGELNQALQEVADV